jgi:hypothetical protein
MLIPTRREQLLPPSMLIGAGRGRQHVRLAVPRSSPPTVMLMGVHFPRIVNHVPTKRKDHVKIGEIRSPGVGSGGFAGTTRESIDNGS